MELEKQKQKQKWNQVKQVKKVAQVSANHVKCLWFLSASFDKLNCRLMWQVGGKESGTDMGQVHGTDGIQYKGRVQVLHAT